MRDGWEIRKLGEVVTFQRGLTYSKDDEVDFSSNCVLRSNNIELETMSILLDELKYIREDFIVGEDKKVKKDTILICMSNGSKQHLGKVAFIDKDYDYAFGGFMGLIKPNSGLSPKYLYYSCLSSPYKHFLAGIGNGANINNIKFSDLSQFSLPVPPISEQEHIVAELDLLSGIIEKKRQQLKELDNLAQSIFYDMFGDPITNEKGWEVLAIDNVCSSIVRGPFGSALKKEFFVEPSNDAYKVYEQKHAIQKSAVIGTYYISSEKFRTLSRFEVKNGDIIMSCSGTIGEFYEIPNGAERGIMNQALLKFTLNSLIHKSYFLYTMEWVKENFEKKGSGLQNIGSVKTIKETSISIPPLSLQQEFAKKIEAIEKQKELIKQSLAETETLFNSRMDYYFN